MEKKNGEIWRLEGCGPGKVSHRWWVHVRVFVRLVNVLRSWALAGTSWWTLPSLAPLCPLPPPSSCSQPSSVQRWRERNEEKERAEWKCRRESEWLGERERSIFETPVPLGTELLSPPHAQWRSKGGGNWTTYYCLFPGYSTNGSLGQRGGAL